MDYLTEIAKQGLGYLLFVGAVAVNLYQYKENRRINDRFIDYMQKYGDINSAVARDIVNSMQNMKGAIESLTDWMQYNKKL